MALNFIASILTSMRTCLGSYLYYTETIVQIASSQRSLRE